MTADLASDAYTQTLEPVGDGLRVGVREYAPVGKESAAPPVLCLHGLTRNVRDFEELAPRIAALGRRVIVVEQRGRGISDWDPDPARYNPAVYAQDMLGLMEARGIKRVVIVGTSLGGIMAMLMAHFAPDRLAGVALNDIGPVVGEAGLDQIKSYVGLDPQIADWAAATDYARKTYGGAYPMEDSDAFWDTFARRIFREEAGGGLRLDYDPAIAVGVRAGDAAPPDLWAMFDALASVPLLVIHGAISAILEPETVAAMRVRRPDMPVAEVPDTGHAPHLSEPEAWDAIAAFLRTC